MENCEFKNLKDLQKKLKDQSIKKKLCKIYYIILIIDFEEQKKFNEDFEKKLTDLYTKKIQRYELFEKKIGNKDYDNYLTFEENNLFKVKKIEEKDADFVKVTKLVFGFRENPEFLFRTLRFLDDIRISTMNYAIHERQKVFDKIDNSFYYFIANNLFNNLTFTNSKDDEFLSVIFRLLKEQINEKYDHFLEKNSVLSNIFKAMLIQIDMKEKFKEILQEILFKMEELSDEEWLLDIHDINKFIYELKLKEKKGPITQKVRNIFLEKRKDILKQDERLFRKFIKYKVKELIDENYEEKYYNTKGIIASINSLFQK